MTKQEFTARVIRAMLTEADVDLRRGSKRAIEDLILAAINSADARWPAYVKEITPPRHEGRVRLVMEPGAPIVTS